jgi:CheY-like chemotaxis protein
MSRKVSVLLADDNDDFRTMCSRGDQGDGIEIIGYASDGINTVAKVRELKPDIVVLDIILPGLDGLGVLSR